MPAEQRVLEIDFTNPNKVKSTYDIKKYDVVKIITGGNEDFIAGIDSATASGNVLTVKIAEIYEQGHVYPSKTVKFKNVRDDILVQAWGLSEKYYDKTFEDFYFEPKFENSEKTWLAKPSSTKVTGTSFGEEIDIANAYTPTAKNLKKKVGVKINAGAGDDTIIGTKYKDTITGGAGADEFVFTKTSGIDTVTDPTNEDAISLPDGMEDLTFVKNGNNLELVYDDNNKLILKNHFKKAENQRLEWLLADEEEIKLSQQDFVITGKGKLVGTESNDLFTSTKSNDTFTGKTGENIIEFSANKFGKDVVNLTEGENLVLDFSNTEYTDWNIKRTISGNNLVLTVRDWNEKGNKTVTLGTVTIKNFAKENVVGDEGSVILRLPEEDINLNDTELDVRNVKSNYKGARFDEYIEADYATKAITITGGQGDDYIVGNAGNGKKAMTFTFSAGDGDDRIYDTKANDVIRIDTAGEITYENKGGDLLIGYGNGDSILVGGYYLAEDDKRIDTLKVKNASGKYDTISLAEETDVEEYKEHVRDVKINDGLIELPADTKYTTLNLVGINMLTHFEVQTDGWEGKDENDLYIAYGNDGDMIILKDYVKNKGNHPVKYVTTNGQTYDVPQRYYLEPNDSIQASPIEEYIYLENGNHTINFGVDNHFENMPDYIYSEGAQYTDTLILDDYSFRNGEIEIGRETENIGSLCIDAYDGKETDRENHILYKHYFDGNTPLVNIVDKNGTIVMDRTFATATRDWSTESESSKDHVLFVNNNGDNTSTTTITSNTNRNSIIVDAYTKTVGNVGVATAVLDYTYKGGNDTIDSGDYYSDDTYRVDNFSATSKLTVLDGGGYSDTAIFKDTNSEDLYLLFDVGSSRYFPDERTLYDTWGTDIVHKDAMTVETLKECLAYYKYNDTDYTVAGVARFNGAGWSNADPESEKPDSDDYGGTIEYIKTKDIDDRLDIGGWKKYIAGRVNNWMDNTSTTKGGPVSFNYGNITALMNAIDEGKDSLTDAQYESLLNCFKVKYSDVPKDTSFVSTSANETFDLGLANNTVTFNDASFGKDTVNSSAEEYNESYKDKFIFNEGANLSVKGGSLDVNINNKDLIISADTNNSVTYKNFVSDENHNDVILTDSTGDIYNISTVTSGSRFGQGTNNIAFVYNDKNSNSVGGTTGRNFIYSYGENTYYVDETTQETRGMWNCDYKGGEDTVVSYTETGSDGYEVWAFDTNSKLYVSDAGGAKDSLLWGDDNKDVSYLTNARFVFDVNSDGSIDYNDSLMFVHKDKLSGTTLNSAVKNNLTAGVLKYDMASSGTAFGLEKVTNDNYNPETRERESIDINAWADEIVEGVQGWLTNHNTYTSAYDAFENCNDADALADLVACYNVDYTQLNQG